MECFSKCMLFRCFLQNSRCDTINQSANMVSTGEKHGDDFGRNRNLFISDHVEYAFNHMGEMYDVIESEQARRAFDGMGCAKDCSNRISRIGIVLQT